MKRYGRMIIPYLVWGVIILFLPMVLMLFYSVSVSGNGILPFRFTMSNYIKFFTDRDFLIILWRSLAIAFKTVILCVILGYPVAYYIAGCDDGKRNLIVLVITLPMLINMLVRTYAWIGMLSDGGLFQTLIEKAGFGKKELMYTEGAVILGMVYDFIPYMILQINTSLCKLDRSLIEASNDLGADRVYTFVHVTLPLSVPGIASGVSLVFLPAVSSFFVPKMLGGGQYFLIGNVIENQFITVGEWNFGASISVIMAAVMMLMMYVVRKIEEKTSGAQ